MDPKVKEKEFKGKKAPRKEAKREKDPKGFKDKDKFPDRKFINKGHNNITWRTTDTTMAELVGNLPFGMPLGLSQNVLINKVSSGAFDVVLPGIMSVRTRLTAGGTMGTLAYNSAINLAARKMYSFIRHANSGSKNYEAVDLIMYLLAIQQALGLLGWIQRAYRLVNEYSTTNRYTPAALLRIMGLDADDLIANQPQLKYLIAWFGRAIGALAFPDIPVMHASYEAYKWVVRDNDSPKEQFYLLDCAGFAKYDPTLTSAGGGVTYTTTIPWGTSASPLTFQNLYDYVHDIMDVILSDEDCGIISGDILKAYRDGGLFKIEAFGDYDVFVKDEEILQQIHNCHVIPETNAKLDYYEQIVGGTNQAPYAQPHFTNPAVATNIQSNSSVGDYLLIDAFSRVPDSKEVINCTVLNPQYKLYFVTGANQVNIDAPSISFDLHLPVSVAIANGLTPSDVVDVSVLFSRWFVGYATPNIMDICSVSAFDWHPFAKYYVSTLGGGISAYGMIGDHQNSRYFSYEVGRRIHENSLLSLFNFQNNNMQ